MVDLALPHDVDPAVAELPGVRLVGLARLAEELTDEDAALVDVVGVRRIVTEEIQAFLNARRLASVTPTVVALRTMATGVVDAELARLDSRLPDLDPQVRAELELAVRRVARQADAPADGAGQGAGQHRRRGVLRRGAGRALLPRPAGRRRRDPARTGCAVTQQDPDQPEQGLARDRAPRRHPRLAARPHPGRPRRRRCSRERLGVEVELVEVTTEGDVSRAPLASMGGVGVFVGALRDALLAGRVDVAVHSLKDLPTAPADGIALAAVPLREDPRDVVVARDGLTLGELPVGAGRHRLAAARRAAARARARAGGRADPRQRRHPDRQGRRRASSTRSCWPAPAWPGIGRLDEVTEVLDPLQMLPAPGQGALAVECRAADAEPARAVAQALDDPATRAAVTAERRVLADLEAGCSAPVGALAEVVEGEDGEELWIRAVVLSPRRRRVGAPLRRRAGRRGRRTSGTAWPPRCSRRAPPT